MSWKEDQVAHTLHTPFLASCLQSSKAHRNGIKKPATNKYPSLRGVSIRVAMESGVGRRGLGARPLKEGCACMGVGRRKEKKRFAKQRQDVKIGEIVRSREREGRECAQHACIWEAMEQAQGWRDL